jgi:hypothetical protein
MNFIAPQAARIAAAVMLFVMLHDDQTAFIAHLLCFV